VVHGVVSQSVSQNSDSSILFADSYVNLYGKKQYRHISRGKTHRCTGTDAIYRPYGP